MIFCGQCGLQLPPGSTRCPRCGASVEPADVATTGGDLHIDDATIASRAFSNQNQQPSPTPINQQPLQTPVNQPLILRGNDYSTQDANGATSRVEQVNHNTQIPPTQQIRGNSYSGYPPLQGTSNPPFLGNQSFQSNSGYPVQNTGGYPPQAPYPGYQLGMPYTDVPQQIGASYQQYPLQPQPTHTKGRTTGLILVFIGLLLILSAAILFAMQQGLIGSKKATGGSNGGTITAITTIQQTQNVSQHYYSHMQQSDTYLNFYVNYKKNTQQHVPFYIITQDGTIKCIVPSMQPKIPNGTSRL